MNNVYFIGIGGIGMSALARYYKYKGFQVSGYDRTPSTLTHELENEGIAIHYEDREDLVPKDKDNTLVIYTPAIPHEMKELEKVLNEGYKVIKRSQALGELTRGQRTLAVAGTHGKTTTSTLVAHILKTSPEGCSAFLGGISINYGTNFLLGDNNVVVVEADEFDRSFLQLHPQIAAITAMDADHLDIYKDLAHVQQAYREFASQVSEAIVAKYGLPLDPSTLSAKFYTYDIFNPKADFHASNLRLDESGHYTFDLIYPQGVLKNVRVGTLGLLNVENSIAASAICLLHGVDPEWIKKGIGSFMGVKRRLEEHVNKHGITYIDDYAHHPAELKGSLDTIRTIFPDRKICAVFQPHLYTRTRDFASEFAKSLSIADEVVLLDIYPAREEPIEGVSSELIFKDITCKNKWILPYDKLLEWIKTHSVDVLVTFGAGSIDRLVDPITEILENK